MKCPECDGTGTIAVCSRCGGLASFYVIGDDIEANCPACDRISSNAIPEYDIVPEPCMDCNGEGQIDIDEDFFFDDSKDADISDDGKRRTDNFIDNIYFGQDLGNTPHTSNLYDSNEFKSQERRKSSSSDENAILKIVIILLLASICAFIFSNGSGLIATLIFWGLTGFGLYWLNKTS